MTTATGPRVRFLTSGHLHGPASDDADLVLNVTRTLSDPARIGHLLDSDGRDPAVQNVVLATPGAPAVLALVSQFVSDQSIHTIPVIEFRCAGGRHRSAALAELAAIQLRAVGYVVDVEHLHIHLPRVLRDTTNH